MMADTAVIAWIKDLDYTLVKISRMFVNKISDDLHKIVIFRFKNVNIPLLYNDEVKTVKKLLI